MAANIPSSSLSVSLPIGLPTSAPQTSKWMKHSFLIPKVFSYLPLREMMILAETLCRDTSSLQQRVSMLTFRLTDLTTVDNREINRYVKFFNKFVRHVPDAELSEIFKSTPEKPIQREGINDEMALQWIAARCSSLQAVSISLVSEELEPELRANTNYSHLLLWKSAFKMITAFQKISSLTIKHNEGQPALNFDLHSELSKDQPSLFNSLTHLDISTSDINPQQFIKFRDLTNLRLRRITIINSTNAENSKDLIALNFSQLRSLELTATRCILAKSTLPQLQDLNLRNGLYLEDSDLNHLKDLLTLTRLNISICPKITGFCLLYIKHLPQLQLLDLRGNKQIRQTNLTHLNSNLQHLNISSCKITDLKYLPSLPILKRLDVSQNPITSLDHLTPFVKMEDLNISYCRLSDLIPIASFFELRNLNISNNNIADLIPLRSLIKMEQLNLSGCPITHLDSLAKFTELRTLKMFNTRVSDLTPVRPLVKIEYLDVSKCSITDLDSLMGLTEIRHLDVSFTPINSTCLGIIKNLLKLNYLNITGCHGITAACVEELILFYEDKFKKRPVVEIALNPISISREADYIIYNFQNFQLVVDPQHFNPDSPQNSGYQKTWEHNVQWGRSKENSTWF